MMIFHIVGGTPVGADLKASFPNTSFPADLSKAKLPEGYVWVQPTPAPVCNQFERVEPGVPQNIDGVWKQTWQVVPWSAEEIQHALTDALQQHLDDTARTKSYDGILSLCSYATSPNQKFATEGQAAVHWRDACWTKGYEILAECKAGNRPVPTTEQLIAELPVFVWP